VTRLPDAASAAPRYSALMITSAHHAARRRHLATAVGRPILLMGNGVRARNLPMTALPFRQDSSFLYFTGCATPGAAALIDGEHTTLFVPVPPPDDELWHGPAPDAAALRHTFGVDAIRDPSELQAVLGGRDALAIAVPDEEQNRRLRALLDRPFAFGQAAGDPDLIDAIIALRRVKQPEELACMRQAAAHTKAAFLAVMGATRPGVSERGLAALFHAVLASRGCATGYDPILTVRGEILHNHSHEGTCAAGDLLLLDGGGEVPQGYGVDVTRTWPVDGRPDARQTAVLAAVLQAQQAAIARCRPTVRYREVHDTACRVLATFLRDEGLLRCSVDESIESGAHGVFFPHGTGHHLGLDVHDLENFGDRSSYAPGASRPSQFGTRYLRLDLPLEPGWVVTVEPGLYAVPAILRDPELRRTLGDRVDWDKAQGWLGFGGVRIEDDIVITEGDPENLTSAIPRSATELAEVVGRGPTLEDRLC